MLFFLQNFFFSLFKAPWFDSQYFSAKRAVRKFEQLYRADRSTASWNKWQKEVSFYRRFFYSKHTSFLTDSIKSASSSKSKWGFLFRLLNKNSPPFPFFPQLFQDKILSSRNEKSSPIFTKLCDASHINLSPVTLSELTNIINSMSSSTCSFDLIPTHIFKNIIFLNLIIHELINLFLTTTILFFTLKKSFLTPLIKKFSLDPSLPTDNRLIFYLSFILKILEKVVYFQLLPF